MNRILLSLVRKITRQLEGTGIGKVKPLFKIYAFMLFLLKPKMVITEDSKMYLDKTDSLLLSVYPNFEPLETQLTKKYVKKGMVVVDAGAHIGYFTLLMSRLVGDKGVVHAFEPERENFELLEKNVKINGYQNITINRKALSDKKGKTKLFISDENPQDHRIIKNRESKKYELVQTITLDNYFGKGQKVDFIKMDIQGAEIFALKGGKRILQENKLLKMIIEFWPFALVQSGMKPDELLKMLQKLGKVRLIDGKTNTLKDIENLNIASVAESNLSNLLFERYDYIRS